MSKSKKYSLSLPVSMSNIEEMSGLKDCVMTYRLL